MNIQKTFRVTYMSIFGIEELVANVDNGVATLTFRRSEYDKTPVELSSKTTHDFVQLFLKDVVWDTKVTSRDNKRGAFVQHVSLFYKKVGNPELFKVSFKLRQEDAKELANMLQGICTICIMG